MNDIADTTEKKAVKPRGKGKPFQKGQSGNPAGRPIGTRHKLCEAFMDACYRRFKEGGEEALALMCRDDPVAFCQMIGKLVPKEYQMSPETVGAFGKIWEWIGKQKDSPPNDQAE
jgi:hypothetical protein